MREVCDNKILRALREEKLTEDIIKRLHFILKHDTKDSTFEWFAVGEYKKHANVVGGHKTAEPARVHERMAALMKEYNATKKAGLRIPARTLAGYVQKIVKHAENTVLTSTATNPVKISD